MFQAAALDSDFFDIAEHDRSLSREAFTVVPLLGPVAGIWTLVASVIAIRQGLDFDTRQAIASAIGGWLLWLLLQSGVSIIGASIF